LAFAALLIVGGTIPAIAQDQKLTCKVNGGSFVLDDLQFP
jgi:hypothetical protein